MKSFKIIDTEIIDNTVEDKDGDIQPSEISVSINIEIDGENYYLDYQTTTTFDYGAYSSELAPYDGTDDYETLKNLFDEEDDFYKLVSDIADAANVQTLWKEYVCEKYDVDENHFNGMDANSEINLASKK